jgi:hypothetical protein
MNPGPNPLGGAKWREMNWGENRQLRPTLFCYLPHGFPLRAPVCKYSKIAVQ